VPSHTRTPLSRERILGAAVALADEHGVEALTMRRLGDELGFEAMSLYRHVASKDDLLDGMLDLVLAETEPPAADVGWADAVRRSALSVHDALGRHPWATRLLMAPQHIRPPRFAYMNALLGRLRAAGFSAETTYTAYHVLDAYIFGFSLWLTTYERGSLPPELVERLMREIPFDDYPHLREHRDQHMSEGAHRDVDAFAFGLDLILDGLEKLRR
jgi:AcrR family transcriptional regulator